MREILAVLQTFPRVVGPRHKLQFQLLDKIFTQVGRLNQVLGVRHAPIRDRLKGE